MTQIKVETRHCLEQIAIIDAMLASNSGTTRRGLAEACGCSPRTISRYLVWIRDVLGVEPTRLGYGPHQVLIWQHGQTPIFTSAVRRKLLGRIEVMT